MNYSRHVLIRFLMIICLCILFPFSNTFAADSQINQVTPILNGKLLVVDMDHDGKVSKQTVMDGTDLVLAVIKNNETDKTASFTINTITNTGDLAKYDSNHDGTIEKNELALSSLVLLRFSPNHSITIIPLALSQIQQLHYANASPSKNDVTKNTLNIWLVSTSGEKYQTYYLEIK